MIEISKDRIKTLMLIEGLLVKLGYTDEFGLKYEFIDDESLEEYKERLKNEDFELIEK